MELKEGMELTLTKYGVPYKISLLKAKMLNFDKRFRKHWLVYDSQEKTTHYIREDYIKERLNGKRGGGLRKLQDKIYDGRWKVVDRVTSDGKHTQIVLENIYNKKRIKIRSETFKKIEKGETTVTNVVRKQIATHTGKYGI